MTAASTDPCLGPEFDATVPLRSYQRSGWCEHRAV